MHAPEKRTVRIIYIYYTYKYIYMFIYENYPQDAADGGDHAEAVDHSAPPAAGLDRLC